MQGGARWPDLRLLKTEGGEKRAIVALTEGSTAVQGETPVRATGLPREAACQNIPRS